VLRVKEHTKITILIAFQPFFLYFNKY